MKAKPIEVSRGNVTVMIYTVQNKVNGVSYPQFVLTYKLGTRPGKDGKILPLLVRRKFADLSRAKREAELVATKLANGEGEAIKLTGADRKAYLDGVIELRPFGLTVSDACRIVATAHKRLPQGVTIDAPEKRWIRSMPLHGRLHCRLLPNRYSQHRMAI